MSNPERRIIVAFKMAPGDVLMVSSLVRDLKLQYGDRYQIDVRTNFPAHWRHNPYLTPLDESSPGVEFIQLEYTPRTPSRHCRHFCGDFRHDFKKKTGIPVKQFHPHGDLHLHPDEMVEPKISGRYWIIIPGGKTDMTTKWWSQTRYQQVVDRLIPYGLNFVQEGATKNLCVHPPLDNVLNVVGQTSIRDLIVNIYHAEGVICGITFPMHVAGALARPCVVIAGGREEPHWEAYTDEYGAFPEECSPTVVPHKFLHTFNQLDCCTGKGCWKQRTHKLNDGAKHDKSLCDKPAPGEHGQIVPKCLDMITVDHVAEAVMSYYEDGYLPPPSWSLEARNDWRRERKLHAANPGADWGLPAAPTA